jgi:hypothetical protein
LIFAVDNTLWFGSSGSEVPIRYFGKLNAHMHFVHRRRVEPTALPFSSVKTHPYFQKVCLPPWKISFISQDPER